MIVNNTTQTEYIQRVESSEVVQRTNSTFKTAISKLVSIYEKLLDNFNKNIKTSQEENEALLQELTKNNKSNPLDNTTN